MARIYTDFSVKLNGKIPQAGLYAAVVMLGAGCSGINASKSISPASFFLPGLLKADPPPAKPDGVLPADLPALPAPGLSVERAFNVALAQ
jgi:hypothetical protein